MPQFENNILITKLYLDPAKFIIKLSKQYLVLYFKRRNKRVQAICYIAAFIGYFQNTNRLNPLRPMGDIRRLQWLSIFICLFQLFSLLPRLCQFSSGLMSVLYATCFCTSSLLSLSLWIPLQGLPCDASLLVP